ncbi:uncharacterized protein CBL_04886 [Carabus blaptoides fortunei]
MNTDYPKGVCTQMCSDEEIIQRQREGLLHALEIIPGLKNGSRPIANRNRVVKEFTRSAAGRNSQNVNNLRTIGALLETINYLLHDVITADHVPWNVRYDFIMDRLRAVRQDMVIQNLSRSACISILQPIVKFYAYSAYRMCEEDVSKFDPLINRNHLQECLKRLLCLYDEIDNLMLKAYPYVMSNSLYAKCRPFMECLYLLVNLGDTTAMTRNIHVPAMWRSTTVNDCLSISIEAWRGNYVGVCKQIRKLPHLLAATAVLHLPYIRKQAFIKMSTAYSSRHLTFPSAVFQNILLYNNVEEVLNDCDNYGVPISNGNIAFLKTSIHADKKELTPRHIAFVDEILSRHSVTNLLLEDVEY